jgi:thioester reductase-like protein
MSRVLVTGGTGVVGSALVQELRDDFEVACLLHTRALGTGCEDVVSFRGDLTRPRLGLDGAEYARLAGDLAAIVHCAAVIDFNVDAETIHTLNVQGTSRVLDLAADAGVPLYYTSSAFITRTDLLDPAQGGAIAGMHEYLRSKLAAEEAVRTRGVPYAIARPPLLFSDTRTGLITREQAFHKIIRGVVTGKLPFLPWSPATRIDFMPQDVVARALAALVRAGAADGAEHWVTAGDAALTAQAMLDTCVAVMAGHGEELVPPRFLDLDVIQRLIVPAFRDVLPELDRQRFDQLVSLAVVFGTEHPFPSSVADIPGGPPPPTEGELRDVLALTIEKRWARVRASARRLAEVG